MHDGRWFIGSETERWLRLKKSGDEVQCVNDGLLLRLRSSFPHAEAFARVCAEHNVNADGLLKVLQIERDGSKLDTADRVQLGATLLRDLVKAGL